mmetsp:Transcript_7539/g.19120  ORF Transcript_7539/g.19120 Transcript_7539/m.19120 type:complete len:167 (-) Transcript_7539:98-598(-)
MALQLRAGVPLLFLQAIAVHGQFPFMPDIPGMPSSPLPTGKDSHAGALKVCGNYCGPGWCDGKFLPEDQCDEKVAPETSPFSGPSCSDSCCRDHDVCCGAGPGHSKVSCNSDFVECLKHCGDLDMSCMNGYIPVPAGAIEKTMGVIEDWCCGEPCKKDEAEMVAYV